MLAGFTLDDGPAAVLKAARIVANVSALGFTIVASSTSRVVACFDRVSIVGRVASRRVASRVARRVVASDVRDARRARARTPEGD